MTRYDLRRIGYIGTARLVSICFSILLMGAIGRLLSLEELSNFYLLQAYGGFFALVAAAPLGTFWEFNANSKSQEYGSIVASIFIISCILLSVSGLVCSLITKGSSLFFIVAFSFGIATYLGAYVAQYLNIIGRQIYSASLVIVFSSLNLALAVCFYSIWGTEYGWVLGIIVSCCIVSGLFFYLARNSLSLQRIVTNMKISFARGTLLFLTGTALIGVANWGQQQLFKPLVETYYGADILAGLGFCFSLGTAMVSALDSVFKQLFAPMLYMSLEEQLPEVAWESYAAFQSHFVSLACCICLLWSYELLYIFSGEKFIGLSIVLMIGCVIEVIRSYMNLFTIYCQKKNLHNISIYISFFITSLLVAGLIGLAYTEHKAIMIVAVAVLSSFVVGFMLMCLFLRKQGMTDAILKSYLFAFLCIGLSGIVQQLAVELMPLSLISISMKFSVSLIIVGALLRKGLGYVR